MIGIVSGSGVCASVVFLTSLDEIGSRYHSCMHNTNSVHPTNNRKRKITNKNKEKQSPSYLGSLDLDDF